MNLLEKNLTKPRILLIRLSAIGDVMHTTSVAAHLRRLLPEAHISWLVSPPASLLLENNPDVDELIIWDRRKIDNAAKQKDFKSAWRALKEARATLKEHGPFDLVLDVQGLFLTGLLARLSGAPRRIGIHERHEGNPLFMTEMAPNIASPHKVKRYLSALLPLGFSYESFRPGLTLRLPPALEDFSEKFWEREGLVPEGPILMVNIRTTWEDKHLTPKEFAALLNEARLPECVQLAFPGTKGDLPYIEECLAALAPEEMARRIAVAAGKTSLMELAALIKSSTLLLTCDTGPLYLAEAVGTPTLSLWGPTLPSIYGPLSEGHDFMVTPNACRGCCKTRCQKGTNACMRSFDLAAAGRALHKKMTVLLARQ